MKSGLQAYFDLIAREHDCYGTWLPGAAIAVGEIGRISRNGSFNRSGSLSSRAEMPQVRTVPEPDQTISTSGGVTFSAGANVATEKVIQVLASAGATLDITFVRAEAAAMILQEVVSHEFDDEQAVRNSMQKLLGEGKIAEDEVVVTYVKEAASGVIATTYDADAGVDVQVDAKLGKGKLTVAKIGGRLKVTQLQSSQTVAVAEPGRALTPMYRALVFRRNRDWWAFWRTYIEIGSAIPTRHFGPRGSDNESIAAARPSMVDGVPDDVT
jgi:hypothetical protein